MDKLEKLPPKDIKPFKDSPIAQGIISNTLFQILWNGIYFTIGLLIRHYALIFGIPPFVAILLGVVGFFLMSLSVNLLRRRKESRNLNVGTVETPKPVSPIQLESSPDEQPIEIFSPFADEEVGLYETVRGRVFPPDQELQVVIYAPDKNWYPQKPVEVKGELWSVKCQFGQLEGRGGDAFKIAAVLGSQLNEKMWYSVLPDRVRSNVIQVRRQEFPTEQRLNTALNDLENAKLEVNQERNTKDEIYKLYRDTERKLAELTWLASLAAEQAKNIANYVVVTIATYPSAGELVLEGSDLCIILGLNIRNESIFDISILPKDVSGSMAINGKFLKEPASILINDFRGPIENLQPRKTQMLVLEQPLRQSEAERIIKSLAETGSRIWIGGLTILISSSSNSSVKVEPKPASLSDRDSNIPLIDFKCDTKSPVNPN